MSDKADDREEGDMCAAAIGNQYAKGSTTNGRPTLYKDEYAEQVYKLCLLGATDADIANFFEVNEDTIYEWYNQHEDFSDSKKRGKLLSDMDVAEALYKTTKDRVVVEQQAFKIKVGQFEETIEVVEVEKIIPADFRAQQLWLKNRRSAYWKEKQEIDHTTNGEKIEQTTIIFSNGIRNESDQTK